MFNAILVPVDLTVPSDTSDLLARARTLKDTWGSTVHVASVLPDVGYPIVSAQLAPGADKDQQARARGELQVAVREAGLEAELHVATGTIYDRVIHLAEKLSVDLIVIGAHRPELKDYLLGSNAARLVRHSNRSVLVVRH